MQAQQLEQEREEQERQARAPDWAELYAEADRVDPNMKPMPKNQKLAEVSLATPLHLPPSPPPSMLSPSQAPFRPSIQRMSPLAHAPPFVLLPCTISIAVGGRV